MVKSKLIQIIFRKTHQQFPSLELQEVEKAVEITLAFLKAALASGQRIEIRDFGAFTTRRIPARQGRNPKTGAAVAVPAKKAIHFKTGGALRSQVNRKSSALLQTQPPASRDH